MKVKIKLNGSFKVFRTSEEESVLQLLRKNGIKSVRDGCNGEGACGACAILLDGKLVNSCLLKVSQIDGKEILTVEGLSKGQALNPIQKTFIDTGVVQCGYCTPSQILAVKELLDSNDNPTNDDVKDALSGSLCRCTGYKQIYNVVDVLVKRKKNNTETFRDDLNIVGKPYPRIDGIQFVKAQISFTEDKIETEALVIKVKRSPHAHAKIKNIDVSKAEELEGVELIVTYKNSPDVLYNTAGQCFPEPSPYDRKLVDDTVRFVGDRVAIVAAIDEETAQKAMELINVEYDVMDAVFDIESASADGAPKIHTKDNCIHKLDIGADLDRNIAASNSGSIGNLKKGFSEADVIIEREYTTTRVQCAPMELHIAYTEMVNDRLIVRSPTQVPFHVRRILARIIGISEIKIRVIKEKIGGGFGSKQDMVIEEIPAWITWQTGKPAYLRYTREEEFITRPRYAMKIKVRAGARKDGTLTAIDMQLKAAAGAYGPHCLTVPMNSCSKSLPIFRCPNVGYSVTVYYTNNPVSGAYQGYGAPQGTFAIQLAISELANELGIDHVRFLKKNAVKKGDRLEILKCLGEGKEGIAQVVSSAGTHKALEEGARMIDWQKKEKSENPDILIGKGTAIVQQGSGLPGIDSANAIIKMLGDGNFMVLFGGTDLGTGLDTVAAKIAAEMLQVDIGNVTVTAADTDTTPFDVGSYASSGTFFSGMSVYKAAENMKEMILRETSKYLGVNLNKLKLEYPGKVCGPGCSLTYREIAHKTQSGIGRGQLISLGSFTTLETPIPYGAHFVQISLDRRTGELNIDKYYALHDCGTPINPELAKGQIYGGVLKTIGHSIYEELKFDDKGKCLTTNFLDYKVPMISELPEDFQARLIFVEDHLGPYGAKSLGEVVANGAAPAIASAIYAAAGIWIRSWPFTPEKVLNALNNK